MNRQQHPAPEAERHDHQGQHEHEGGCGCQGERRCADCPHRRREAQAELDTLCNT